MLLIAGADDIAHTCLDAAQSYLETAIQHDDLGNFRRFGQDELGAAQRLRSLVITRWLQSGELDSGGFRDAVLLKDGWNHRIFGLQQWRKTGFQLHEWLAEQIILGEYARARGIIDTYYWTQVPKDHKERPLPPEQVFALVADSLIAPDDLPLRRTADASLDAFYLEFTSWSPDHDENAVPYDQKLLYAYIRGKYFKGIEDPIRLIKMMRFSE